MFACSFFYTIKRRFVMFFLILLLLSGCGSSTLSAPPPQNTPARVPSKPASAATSTSTSISTTSGSGATTSQQASLGTSIDFDLGGWLHIHSTGGFVCTIPTPSGTPVAVTPGLLVLPTVQPTYDQGILQPLENYLESAQQAFSGVNTRDTDTGNLDGHPYPAFSANSSAFQLMAGTLVSLPNSEPGRYCSEVLHITNTGNAAVQISQISVRLTADTYVNNQHYNLIDICSVPPRAPGCGPLPSGGGEPVYTADFTLHSGKANAVIPASSWGLASLDPGPKPPFTLKPGEVGRVDIFYESQNNLSFSFLPSFTLDWPGKETTYPVPQLQETFSFASDSQFSCYSLRGQRFIKNSSGVNASMDTGTWCI